MGVCACRCRQSTEFLDEISEEETPEQRWRRFVVSAQRIAYKRRQWAALGHWLRVISSGRR